MMTLEAKPTPDDIILFTDTLWESPGTYKFLDDFEKNEGLKVHRACYEHKQSPGLKGFPALLNRKTYLPNRTRRLCTDELKVKTAKRYLRNVLGIQHFDSFIGFRADEEERVRKYKKRYKKIQTYFPLYEAGINKATVDAYWDAKPYKLDIPRILGNCDLCFLKGKDAIITILQHHPELAEKWIKAEKSNKHGGTFIKDISYSEMLHVAKSQLRIFDIELATPAFNCSCGT